MHKYRRARKSGTRCFFWAVPDSALAVAKNHIRCFDNRKAAAATAAASCAVLYVRHGSDGKLLFRQWISSVHSLAAGFFVCYAVLLLLLHPSHVLEVCSVCFPDFTGTNRTHVRTRARVATTANTHVMLCAREHKGKRPLNAHIQFVGPAPERIAHRPERL